MMAGNPNNWWSNMVTAGSNMHPVPPQSPPSSSSSYQLLSSSSSPPPSNEHHHFYGPSASLAEEAQTILPFQRPLSQLFMGELGGNENEKFGMSHFQYKKNWEDPQIGKNNPSSSSDAADSVIKEGDPFSGIGHLYSHDHRLPVVLEDGDDRCHYFQTQAALPSPPHHHHGHHQFISHYNDPPEKNKADDDSASRHSYESNSTSTGSGGASKKARVHDHNYHSSTQPSLKVRKEKLGDRITALHQLVSPFGKTDTASVLSEVIGYVTFLHSQIQALSSPYFGNASRRSMAHIPRQQSESAEMDLRSKGLCLVPLSCTQHVSVGSCTFDGVNYNGGPAADYWAPSLGGGL